MCKRTILIIIIKIVTVLDWGGVIVWVGVRIGLGTGLRFGLGLGLRERGLG